MIRKIDHLGIAVRSIAEGRRLYEALGLAVTAIEEVPEEGVRVALIPCGESLIELLEPLGPDSPIAASWRSAAPASTTSASAATTCRRRRAPPRRRLPGAPPAAHPRRRRLLGAVRPSALDGRRADRALAAGRRESRRQPRRPSTEIP